MTVVCYNVVGSSSGGSGQAGSGGTINLYISFEAEGTQPIDVKFRAAISDKPAVSDLQNKTNSHFNSLS